MKTKKIYFTLLLLTFLFVCCKDEEVTEVNTVINNISDVIYNYSDNSDLIDSLYCYNNNIVLDKCKVNSDGSFKITLPVISSIVNQKITDRFPSKNISDTTALINDSYISLLFGNISFVVKKNNKTTGLLLKNNMAILNPVDPKSRLQNYCCTNFIYCNKFTKIIGTDIERQIDDYTSTAYYDLTLNKGWNEFIYTMVIDYHSSIVNLNTGVSFSTGKTEQIFSNKNMQSFEWRFERLSQSY